MCDALVDDNRQCRCFNGLVAGPVTYFCCCFRFRLASWHIRPAFFLIAPFRSLFLFAFNVFNFIHRWQWLIEWMTSYIANIIVNIQQKDRYDHWENLNNFLIVESIFTRKTNVIYLILIFVVFSSITFLSLVDFFSYFVQSIPYASGKC